MPSDSTAPTPDAGDAPAGTRLLLVELGETLYGLGADLVREIVTVLPAARLPGAPPHVQGIANLRGHLLPVVDLRRRILGTPVTRPEASTVVVSAEDRLLGLVVDEVRDVISIAVVPAGDAAVTAPAGLVAGLGRLGDEVVLVIDVPELVRQTLT